jgi:hypothetical protein
VGTNLPTCGKDFSNTIVYNVGNPVHTKGETRAQKVLRKFDLSYEYGPCVGVSRLERWKRAEDLGLEPPVEVGDVPLDGMTL